MDLTTRESGQPVRAPRARRTAIGGGPGEEGARRIFATVALGLALGALAPAEPAARRLGTDCGGGVEARLSGSSALQGGVLGAEIDGPAEDPSLTVSWDGRPVPLWRATPTGPWRALLGVDLERAAGPVPLLIASPRGTVCTLVVEAREGEFAVRRLTVSRRFVELAPKDLARAERETERLEGLFAQTSGERLWSGPFRLPLDHVEPSSNFGQRRILNGEPRSPHAGVDFSAPKGTAIRAAQRGRVVLVDSLFFSGRTVVLDHGLGLFTFYGHLSAATVSEGGLVEASEPLGEVGSTGRATGPHLHWSVRLHGARVSPLDLVATTGAQARLE